MKSLSKYAVIAATAVAAVAILAVPKAFADVTGVIYQNVPNAGNADYSGNMSSSLANASFTVGAGGINFQSQIGGYNASGFLNNPTFTSEMNGFSATGTIDNSEVVLTGQIYLTAGSNSFDIGHDDGASLSIAGLGNVFDQPFATSFVLSPFTFDNTLGAGTYTFTLDYAECCGAPADLEFAFPSGPPIGSVPEPNSLVLLGTGGVLLLGAYGLAAVKMGGNV